MNAKQSRTLAALAALMLLALVPMAAAQEQGIQYQYSEGMVRMTTESIGVKVTAFNQVPHFHWWNETSNETTYHVMFLKLMEVNDTNDNGAYDPGTDTVVGAPHLLPSSDWEFSGFEVVEEDEVVTSVHFNFTTTTTFTLPLPIGAPPGETPTNFDVSIQIRVHIDTARPEEMKFDIIISGWNWVSEDSLLVFQFTVTESGPADDEDVIEPPEFAQEGNRFQFGEGYMEFAESAQAGEVDIQVAGTHGEGTGDETGESVYLAFEYFGIETLEYDPILGISSADAEDNGNGLPEQIMEIDPLLLVAGGIGVLVVAIVIIRARR